MNRASLIVSLGLVAAGSIASAQVPAALPGPACVLDADCSTGQICVDYTCKASTPPPPPAPPAPPPPPAALPPAATPPPTPSVLGEQRPPEPRKSHSFVPSFVRPPVEEEKIVSGTITNVVNDTVVLNKGSEDGLKVGSVIEVLSQRGAERPNPTSGEMEMVPTNASIGFIEVIVVQEHGALALLKRGNSARKGDHFVTTSSTPLENLRTPPHGDFHHRIAITFRPFLEMGQLGVGSISDLHYSYHFDVPLTAEVNVTPLAFELRAGDQVRAIPTSFNFTLSYDSDLFAIGAGAGALFYSQSPNCAPLNCTDGTLTRGAIFSLVRFGALDGLMLQIRNSFVIRETTLSQSSSASSMTFHWGSTEVAGNIPLNHSLTLAASAGGGDNGWAYGEIGLRYYVHGTGGAGTLIIPLCVGVGGFSGSSIAASSTGPLFSVGLEKRL